ncbi:MAG: glycosyltransferase family 39 protein [Bryobacteraceae bacterium]|jgi:4-amino-4-deoxy-L-arabinose transferase-like glycosyltransferase
MPWRKGQSPALVPLLSMLVFLLAGCALLPYPGLQNDEVFFSGPIYSAAAAYDRIRIGAVDIPLMVMSYTGALKTWLYAGLFEILPPNPWSVRLPMLLLGALTIWLTWCWVRRIAGVRAAAISTVLLSTDTIFLMTNTFDWGPVALQHVLLMAGLLAVQIWLQADLGGSNRRMLALGFFLWGLGMWDKALLSWPLIGLAAASLCVFPRQTLARLRPLTLAFAAASFLIGAAPLVVYNVGQHGVTATRNTRFSTEGLRGKVAVLRHTLAGDSLYGFMVYEDAGSLRRAPATPLEQTAAWIEGHTAGRRTNRMIPACFLALLCFAGLHASPAWRTLLFISIVIAVEWVQMFFTQGAGNTSHHVILMWPFPSVFIGIAWSAMADRLPRFGVPAMVLIVAVLALVNLLTTNRYLVNLAANGAAGGWTDAIYPLADAVQPDSGRWIGMIDWGYLNQLRMLYEAELHLFNTDPAGVKRVLAADCILIQHTEDKQILPGVNGRFRKAVEDLGYVEKVQRVVHDSNGRPVFEIFRLAKCGAGPSTCPQPSQP